MPIISFIIPLYNCEHWISRCLDSIYAIEHEEEFYEVIVVDDGSTDNGKSIVERYKSIHNNLKLIKQDNRGASAARNTGLEVAKGNWIWFVDADDRIIPSAIDSNSDLYKAAENLSYDLIAFNYQNDYGNHTKREETITERTIIDGCNYLLSGRLYLWNKLFRRDALEGIRFVEGTKNIEDFCFNICAIIKMHNVACLPIIGYEYNQLNTFSTSRNISSRNLRKLSDDTQTIYLYLLKFADKLTNIRQKRTVRSLLSFSVAGYLFSLFKFYDNRTLHKGISFLRSNGLYPCQKTYSRKANLFLLLANHEFVLSTIQRIRGLALKRHK